VSRIAPDWPRLMRRETAAMYCDMTPEKFERNMADGRLPLPVKFGSDEYWSRTAIDELLNRLTGDTLPNWRQKSKLYNETA
jgi:predicted DNA-binding transcriptional regulator AlpA